MESETFLQHLRSKPLHVRQRIVFGVVILMSPVLFYVWSATNHLNDKDSASTVDTVRDTISGTFNNSAYQDTFGSQSFGGSQTATPPSQATTPDQTTPDPSLDTQTDTSPSAPSDTTTDPNVDPSINPQYTN